MENNQINKMDTIFDIFDDLDISDIKKDIIAGLIEGAFESGFRAALADCADVTDEAKQAEITADNATFEHVTRLRQRYD